ncbi:MAG: TfuA domain-containing protein [Sphingomonadaceae bacterium]|nr:TfuA domain-containing protein [Sphingomonadaceae bacterium]
MPLSVYIGPTLPPANRPAADNIVYFPPATAGDMLALAKQPPHRVLLIDGIFEAARPPWHKEILVLLAEGFDVWGAASLGALRAAELHRFGMRSEGPIAQAYATGRIIGDDEVAVAHAPATFGHRALSLAQVDVRASLTAALRTRVLTGDEARRLRAASHAIFFKDRTMPALLSAAAGLLPPDRAARFTAWLPAGFVSQKARDAQAAIAAALAAPFAPCRRPPPPETLFLKRLRDERP